MNHDDPLALAMAMAMAMAMTRDQWLEIMRAFREFELNQGIKEQKK